MQSIREKLRSVHWLRRIYQKSLHSGLIPGVKFVPWQLVRNNSKSKWDLLHPVLTKHRVGSVLDVGCDAGQVTRYAAANGFFAVGIDQNTSALLIADPIRDVCFGNIRISEEIINRLPTFDAILLLSVHHQWIKGMGDEEARRWVRALFDRASKVMVFEFSAWNQRYGENSKLFIDNDRETVCAYAQEWLRYVLGSPQIDYLGAVAERPEEPYRYLFSVYHAKHDICE